MSASKSKKTTISLTAKQTAKCIELLGRDTMLQDLDDISAIKFLKLFKELEQLRQYKKKQLAKKKKKQEEAKQNKQSKKATKQATNPLFVVTGQKTIKHW